MQTPPQAAAQEGGSTNLAFLGAQEGQGGGSAGDSGTEKVKEVVGGRRVLGQKVLGRGREEGGVDGKVVGRGRRKCHEPSERTTVIGNKVHQLWSKEGSKRKGEVTGSMDVGVGSREDMEELDSMDFTSITVLNPIPEEGPKGKGVKEVVVWLRVQEARLRGEVVWVVMVVLGVVVSLRVLHLLYKMFLPWRDLSILYDEDDLGESLNIILTPAFTPTLIPIPTSILTTILTSIHTPCLTSIQTPILTSLIRGAGPHPSPLHRGKLRGNRNRHLH